MYNAQEWLEKQWPSSIFYDPRLHKRAVKIAGACLSHPDRSIPKRFVSTADTKACYNFFKRSEMNHQTLQVQHYENVRKDASKASGNVLFIQDGSELLYNSHEWTSGLGPTADAYGSGIMFHSCLAVKTEEGQPQVIGLACQKAWIRKEAKKTAKKKEAD